MTTRTFILSLVAMIAMATPAWANEATGQAPEGASRPIQDGWRIIVGTGAIYTPLYEGDDDYRLSVVPNIQIAYGERFFASVQGGVGYRVVNQPNLRMGPIVKVQFPRQEDGGQFLAVTGKVTTDLVGLGDVDASAELGGFVEHDIGTLTLGLEARQAVTGHKGFVADLSARWSGRAQLLGRNLFWSAGPRVRFVGDNYNAAYFGVTPAQSLASGLDAYQASGGLNSYGVSTNLILPLTADGRWSAVLIAGYDRLEGDAAASPLVQQRGSPSQATAGLFISRQF